MSFKIVVTGGTIDKQYNPITGNLDLKQSQIKDLLSQANCYDDIETINVILKDSLEINLKERQLIAKYCLRESCEQLIITHGTDTMAETACLLNKKITNKTIVITGAMIPFTIKNSDSLFNLGMAIASVQILAHGVYIVIGGKIFNANNVTKNTLTGQFETLNGKY